MNARSQTWYFYLYSNRMKNILLLLVTAVVCINCSAPKEKIPPITTMEKSPSKIMVYQLLVRLFGNRNTTNKPYGTLEENGVGKFNDINDKALDAVKELGITHIWYTGVIEHATLTDYSAYGIAVDDADVVKGRAGSPYAIKDYYDVDPDLAVNVKDRMNEFEQLIERTHSHGLKAIIDFIPNHVARSYRSDKKPAGVKDLGEGDDKTVAFSAKNNFYYLPGQSFTPPKGFTSLGKGATSPTLDGKFEETPAKVTGNDQFTASPGVNEWFETIKLNYGVDIENGRQIHFDPIPDTWTKMRDILLFWAGKKVDGFRCDVAEMVPVEFWAWAIPQVKLINPEIIFIAEIYTPSKYNDYVEIGKFNYLYDKVQLYDTLRLLTNGKQHTTDVNEIQKELAGVNQHLLHFIENHDEQRAASKFFAGDPWRAVPAMVVSATIDRGATMIYFGQEVGEPGIGAEGFSGEDGRTTIFDYWGVPEHQKWLNGGKFNGDSLSAEQKQLRQFYIDLLHLAGNNPAFTRGKYIDLTAPNVTAGNFGDKVLAYIRYDGDERLIVLVSFNDSEQLIKFQLPKQIAQQIGLDVNANYIARDLLWREVEVGFNNEFSFDLKIKPFSSYILKIK
jgi:glycosidase